MTSPLRSQVALIGLDWGTSSLRACLKAGASGFGLGSALFKPGQGAGQLRQQAQAFQRRWAELAAAS